jgi:hypothetical protein
MEKLNTETEHIVELLIDKKITWEQFLFRREANKLGINVYAPTQNEKE